MRALVGREHQDQRLGAHVPERGPAQQQPAAEHQQHAGQVHREDDGARVGGEERAGQQHVDRQPRRAGRERDQQPGQQPLAGVGQDPGRRQGRQVAAEADDQRQQRAPVEAKGTHRAVGDEGGPRQVPGVLEDTEGREHDRHDRQERQHGADADEQTVDQQPLQPAVAQADQAEQPGDRRGQGPVDQLADQALQRRRELGRELEQQPHDRQEHGYAGPRVEQDGVDAVGEGAVQAAAHGRSGSCDQTPARGACRPARSPARPRRKPSRRGRPRAQGRGPRHRAGDCWAPR